LNQSRDGDALADRKSGAERIRNQCLGAEDLVSAGADTQFVSSD
jgi:hypothetical protein